ncbi:DUF1800 family protein [Haloferula sp. A504]|uniref:DUF1800 family protein n=1 Tax=Haloferula sp. A504 TaxID=3373601 RepID=UPI0031C4920E|nr:DUF1800 domain-containing protein [Verrucomicrobiaceae bacterium E54]
MLPRAKNDWTLEEAAHLVRRAGFGASPSEIREIHELGREAAVDSLLEPDESLADVELPEWAEPERVAEERREIAAKMRESRLEQRDMTPEERLEARQKMQREIRREQQQNLVSAGGWWFERMMRSRAPLREKMVIFLHDHFATSAQKVRQPVLMLQQNQLFREHAFGDFRALTHAIATDPAMMLYLDTQTSKKGKPNENFAREVMELFTLGQGNYTEQDIKEAARAFTGYQVNRLTGAVDHNKRQWDDGTKTVLGKTGKFDGPQVIDLIFEQDAAAAYLPSKLWQFFVEDEAPNAVVRDLAATFKAGGFQLKPVLREIFLSRAFYDGTVIRNQIKSPVQFMVQMCRELEIDDLPRGFVLIAQGELGQQLFYPPNVAGWDWGRAWINTNTLLSRYNTAGVVTQGAVNADGVEDEGDSMMEMAAAGGRPGQQMLARMVKRSMDRWDGPDYESIAPRELRKDPEKLVASLMDRLFQADLGSKQKAAFVDYARSKQGVVFTNHEVAELCHLMMSTPHYQLC